MKTVTTIGLILLSGAIGYYFGTTQRSDSSNPVNSNHSKEEVNRADQNANRHQSPQLTEDSRSDSTTFDPSQIEKYLAEIEKLPPGPAKQKEMEKLFREWAAVSGSLAYENAKGLEGRNRLACMTAAAAGWASVAPEEAWAEIMLATNNGSTRQPGLQPIIQEIAKNDLGLAVQLLQGIDNPYYLQNHFQPLIDAAAESRSYIDLLKIVNNLDSVETRGLLAEKVFETWGKYETDAPLEALSSIGAAVLASKALLGFMEGWAQVDGESAFLYAVENNSDPKIAELLSPIAEQWALTSTRGDVASIIEQITLIKDGDIVLSKISRSLAQREPELTMNSISGIENDRARSMTTTSVMGEWARTDLESAKNYYSEMPYDQSKQQAFWALFNAGMQQSKSPESLIGLAFDLGDPDAVNTLLVNMAEYTTVSSYKDRSLALANELARELDSREDIPPETKAKVLEWLNIEP